MVDYLADVISIVVWSFLSYFMDRMNVDGVKICGLRATNMINTRISMVGNMSRNVVESVQWSKDELSEGCRVGIDTHADTSCARKHVRITEYIDGKLYSVSPFNEKYEPLENVKMINGIVAVDGDDGNGYIVELNYFFGFHRLHD